MSISDGRDVALAPLIDHVVLPDWTPELIVIDLDGTVVDFDLEVHPRTQAALRRASTNVPVVIASGRMYQSTKKWAQHLRLTTPLICYQGALVRSQDVLEPAIAEFPLSGATAQRTIEVARRHGWHRQAYCDDQLLCEEDRPEAHWYARIADVPINFVGDLADAATGGSSKVTMVVLAGEQEIAHAEAAIAADVGQVATVRRSLSQLIEVTDPKATKGQALQTLCHRMNIALDRCVAIGDAPNDIDMLKAAGFGVAVAGSGPRVLAAAQATCPGPADAGVADVIEAFGLLN